MTEQLKYRAKIKARGLDTTGVTEDNARAMAATLGGHTMFVVEGIHDTVITDSEGNQQVTLRLTSVEPVPAAHEDTVREFQRALYRQRPDVAGTDILKGTVDGPSVASTARALASAVERDDDGEPVGVWSGDPETPLEPEDKGDDGLKGDEVWPGDEPKGEPAATDEVSKKRAGRKKAGTTVDAEAQDIPEEPVVDEAAERLKQARAALGGSEDEDAVES